MIRHEIFKRKKKKNDKRSRKKCFLPSDGHDQHQKDTMIERQLNKRKDFHEKSFG